MTELVIAMTSDDASANVDAAIDCDAIDGDDDDDDDHNDNDD